MTRKELTAYIANIYSASPDYPWADSPEAGVFRHRNNRKWFALMMEVPREKLGLQGDGVLDVVNVKCGPVLAGSLRTELGFYPAYHMNKENWITIALDGSAEDEKIRTLLDISFELTAAKVKRPKHGEEEKADASAGEKG